MTPLVTFKIDAVAIGDSVNRSQFELMIRWAAGAWDALKNEIETDRIKKLKGILDDFARRMNSNASCVMKTPSDPVIVKPNCIPDNYNADGDFTIEDDEDNARFYLSHFSTKVLKRCCSPELGVVFEWEGDAFHLRWKEITLPKVVAHIHALWTGSFKADYCRGMCVEAEANNAQIKPYKAGSRLKDKGVKKEKAWLQTEVATAIEEAAKEGATAFVIGMGSDLGIDSLRSIRGEPHVVFSGGAPGKIDSLSTVTYVSIRQKDAEIGSKLGEHLFTRIIDEVKHGPASVLVLRFASTVPESAANSDNRDGGDPDSTRCWHFCDEMREQMRKILPDAEEDKWEDGFRIGGLTVQFQGIPFDIPNQGIPVYRQAKELVRKTFTKKRKMPIAVVALFGDLALGACDALAELQLEGKVRVLSADVTSDLLERMYAEDILVAVCGVDSFLYGRSVMKAAFRLDLNKQLFDMRPVLITRELSAKGKITCAADFNDLDEPEEPHLKEQFLQLRERLLEWKELLPRRKRTRRKRIRKENP